MATQLADRSHTTKQMKSLHSAVVPKVGGTATLGAVRNSRGAVKQKWAVGGR